jgi:hypothetical protein
MRYYLAGNGDTFVEASVAPPPFKPKPFIASVPTYFETALEVAKGIKTPVAATVKKIIKTQAVGTAVELPVGLAFESEEVKKALEEASKKATTYGLQRVGAAGAAERLGRSGAVRALEWFSRGASKVAVPLEAAKGAATAAYLAYETQQTAEAMREAAEQEELAELAAVRARAAAERGKRVGTQRLQTQEELMEKLPRVLRRFESERENREAEARFLQRQIEELEKKQAALTPYGLALDPREVRHLWDLRSKRDTSLARMEAASRFIYDIQTMPMEARLRWLAEQEAVAQERGW